MLRQVKTENGWVRGIEAADPRITAFKQRKTMANNVINLETTLLEKKYIATKKRYELLKHFQ